MTWSDFTERFLTGLLHRHFSETTLKAYTLWLSRLSDYAQSHGLLPADLVPVYANAYAAQLQAMGLGDESRMQALGCARRAFRWAVAEGLVAENPFGHVVLPKVRRPERGCLTPEEAAKLLAQPQQTTRLGLRDYTILSFLYGTGVRVSECVWTDVTDVDLEKAEVAVRRAKGGKARLLPLAPGLQKDLEVWLRVGRPPFQHQRHESALFLNRFGVRFERPGMEVMVRMHAMAAGFPGVSPHRLRHAFASHLLAGGADVRDVKDLLGHVRLQATQIYTHPTKDDLRSHLDRTHPRFKVPPGKDGDEHG
jgi:site-specific recombinase XerD